MGWPRKNEDARLYRERKSGAYLMVITANGRNRDGTWDAIANVYEDRSDPCLSSTGASDRYLHLRCKRVEWSELPEEWKEAFLCRMEGWEEDGSDATNPEDVRGFWRIGNQPPKGWSTMKSLADPGEGSVRYPADRKN